MLKFIVTFLSIIFLVSASSIEVRKTIVPQEDMFFVTVEYRILGIGTFDSLSVLDALPHDIELISGDLVLKYTGFEAGESWKENSYIIKPLLDEKPFSIAEPLIEFTLPSVTVKAVKGEEVVFGTSDEVSFTVEMRTPQGFIEIPFLVGIVALAFPILVGFFSIKYFHNRALTKPKKTKKM